MRYFQDVLLCNSEDFESFENFELLDEGDIDECLIYVYEDTSVHLEMFAASVFYLKSGKFTKVSDRGKISIDLRSSHGYTVEDDGSDKSSLMHANRFSNLKGQFYSSLSARDAYRFLIQVVGGKLASLLLLGANDIAALYAFKINTRMHKEFRYSFMFRDISRRDEELFSYLSLKQILEEGETPGQDNIDSLSTVVLFSKCVELPIEFSFKREGQLDSPINVVIGSNGVGKTRLLKGVAENVVRNNIAINSRGANDPSQYVPLIIFSHEKQHWRKAKKAGALCLSLGISSKEWNELPLVVQQLYLSNKREEGITKVEVVLSRFINTRKLRFRVLDSYRGSVSFFELAENPSLCKTIDVSKAMQFVDDNDGVHELSSGQRTLISFTLNVIFSCRRKSLLLIDEPENHLHPQFISLLMQILISALQAVESVAVLVTHSPYIVREVDKDAVLILGVGDAGLPVVYRPTLQTLGGDVSLISDYVFEDLNLRKGYQEMIDRVMSDSYSVGQKEAMMESLNSLGGDAVTYLREKYKD